jgi:hypothetical protein
MRVLRAGLFAALSALAACVNQGDLTTWNGQPLSTLDRHPAFMALPVVRTMTQDGIEIRNYIDSRTLVQCSEGGAIFGKVLDTAAYNRFSSCLATAGACSNVFYLKDDRVLQYTLVGSGGVICSTDPRRRPQAQSSGNVS